MKSNRKARQGRRVYVPGGIAALLLSYSAFHGVPGAVAHDGMQLVANVIGAAASVPITPENTIATQLAAKETSLNERERALLARETNLSLRERDMLPLASFIASIILAILVGLNFFFDYRRMRGVGGRGVVNLKRS